MNLVADENIDRDIVEQLRSEGHRLFYVGEMDPGITDDEVLALANKNHALLITADKDFGELVFRLGKIHHGVILIRLSGLSIATKARLVASALAAHGDELFESFTVLSHNSLRIRRSL